MEDMALFMNVYLYRTMDQICQFSYESMYTKCDGPDMIFFIYEVSCMKNDGPDRTHFRE